MGWLFGHSRIYDVRLIADISSFLPGLFFRRAALRATSAHFSSQMARQWALALYMRFLILLIDVMFYFFFFALYLYQFSVIA